MCLYTHIILCKQVAECDDTENVYFLSSPLHTPLLLLVLMHPPCFCRRTVVLDFLVVTSVCIIPQPPTRRRQRGRRLNGDAK